MNFLKRLFGGGGTKSVTPPAQPTVPMAAPPPQQQQPAAAKPKPEIPPEDMTLIDPVAKDTWKADQWRAQTRPGDSDKKK